jgi:uncharacterized protein
MEIGVFGATGLIGGRIVDEAVRRGHGVTAFSRDAASTGGGGATVAWRVADILDTAVVESSIEGLDVVVNAVSAGRDPAEAAANAAMLPVAARSILAALEAHPTVRVIAIGGSGSLEVRPGLQSVDIEGFADRLTAMGLPSDYINVVLAHREALGIYRQSSRRWTYLSAPIVTSGTRTGAFRTGHDQALTSADGPAWISAEDLAVAVLDEIELPQHVQRRFTVAY